MKKLLILFWMVIALKASSQADSIPSPIEERHPLNYWWWVLGVIIVIALGTAVYMMIKKNPRKDAIR